MKYKSRAQLLRDAAASIEMQEAAGVEPMCKLDGEIWEFSTVGLDSYGNCGGISYGIDYEFPIAVVEGKPVWENDVAYFYGYKRIAKKDGWYSEDGNKCCSLTDSSVAHYTWNPPAPKPQGESK